MNDRFYSNAKAFVATLRAGSMTAASRELKTTKSGVSQKVSSLEADLGLTLLDRSGRAVVATAAGQRIFEICAPMVDAALEAEARLGDGAGEEFSGRVGVSGPNTYLATIIMPVVTEFTAKYPSVQVELKASDWSTDFAADDIDLGFRVGPVPKGRFVRKQLTPTQRVLCANPTLLKRHPKVERPSDLERIPCIIRRQETQTWRLLGPNGKQAAVRPKQALLVDTMELALAAAAAGVGAALLPSLIVGQGIDAGTLIPALPRWHPEPVNLTLLCRPNSLPKPQVAGLRRFFIEHLDQA
jgi:LysR family transcriptional regulator, regulator for bpeEF and oprC